MILKILLLFVLCTLILLTIVGFLVLKYCDSIVKSHKKVHSNQLHRPRLEYNDDIPILHLYGTHSEMGQQYGSILKRQLRELSVLFKKIMPKFIYLEYEKKALLSEHLLTTNMRVFLVEMSKASGVDYNRLLALNAASKVSCSTFAAWGKATKNGKLIMGRNADFRLFKYLNRGLGLLVVKHPKNGFATVSSSFLGFVGSFTGINEKAVCFGNMVVYNGHDKKISTEGLPIQLLMQEAAEISENAQDMQEFILSYKIMTPNNIMCADLQRAIMIESDQKKAIVRESKNQIIFGTNYFMTKQMAKTHKTGRRFNILALMAKKQYGVITHENLKNIMHKARKPHATLQAAIFMPSDRIIMVSMNTVPATKGPFTIYNIDKLFAM